MVSMGFPSHRAASTSVEINTSRRVHAAKNPPNPSIPLPPTETPSPQRQHDRSTSSPPPPPLSSYSSVYSVPTQAPRHPCIQNIDTDTEIPLPGTGRAEPRTIARLCGTAIREPWIAAFECREEVGMTHGRVVSGCVTARGFVRHVSSFYGVSCLWLSLF